MTRIENWFSRWVVEQRWRIIVLTVVAVSAVSMGMGNLYFTTDYRVFFGPENPERRAFESLEQTYTKNDNIMVVLAPEDGRVFSVDTLALVQDLTERAWQTPYSSRVDSITNFQSTEADDEGLVVGDLIGDVAGLQPVELEVVERKVLAEPLLVDRLISADARVTAVNITLQLPGVSPTTETPEAVAYVRALVRSAADAHPDISIGVTGIAMMNNAFTEASVADINRLFPISIAVMAILLLLFLRSAVASIGALLVVAMSVTTALGAFGSMGYPISPPSATAPIVILTVALASSIHFLVSFLEGMRGDMNRARAVSESLRINLQPISIACLTTATGFLTMNFSEVPPFRHLGTLVAIGVCTAFVLSVGFLPALMSVLPVRVKTGPPRYETAMARVADFVVWRQRVLLWGMGALIIVVVLFVPRNELNDVFVHYFDKSVAFRSDTDFMTEHLTGPTQIEISLGAHDEGGIAEPQYLKELDAFAEWLRAQPEVRHVTVLTDIIKRLNMNMHADDPLEYRLPMTRELAAQYLLLYEMSLPYGLDLNNRVNLDKSATRLSLSNDVMSTREVLEFDDRVYAWLESNTSRIVPTHITGGPLMFAHIGQRNIVAMLVGTTLALVLISLILVVALRSLRIGLISLVPNLVPAALGFGLWGMLDGQIGLSLSVVTTMTLGIIVDDSVHFLSKYLRARRESGLPPPAAVRYAFRMVGAPLVMTSVVLLAGFSVLATSSFELNAGMGLLTAVVIALALVADFLFLPPLLMQLDEGRHASLAGARASDSAPA